LHEQLSFADVTVANLITTCTIRESHDNFLKKD
jgi:hypothetical protein